LRAVCDGFALEVSGGVANLSRMNPPPFQVRRAVVDDLPQLERLWQRMDFVPSELELRLTDFQVATDGQGNLLGALAFEIAGHQGRMHHEAFHDFGLADPLRGLLWKKIQLLAQNKSVFRVWTQENAPFWRNAGLQAPDREALALFPAKWSNDQGAWLTLQLRGAAAISALAVDVEFANYVRAERERIEARSKVMKNIAMAAAILFGLLLFGLAIYAFTHDPALRERLHLGNPG
jgi:N-acetylglutamate synthase-like GNAT family acetyltransferase